MNYINVQHLVQLYDDKPHHNTTLYQKNADTNCRFKKLDSQDMMKSLIADALFSQSTPSANKLVNVLPRQTSKITPRNILTKCVNKIKTGKQKNPRKNTS